MHAGENLCGNIAEDELPDITQNDTADQVGKEIGRSEESHALKLGCAQKRQQERDQVDQDHIENNKQRGDQDRPDEAWLAEHPRVVCHSYEFCITDTVPVRKGVEKTQKQRNDDCNNKSE